MNPTYEQLEIAPDCAVLAEGRMLTAAQAAVRLGVYPRTVRRACQTGRLPGAVKELHDGRVVWRIPEGALEPFVKGRWAPTVGETLPRSGEDRTTHGRRPPTINGRDMQPNQLQPTTGVSLPKRTGFRSLTSKRLVENPIYLRLKDRIAEVGDCWEWIGAYNNRGRLPAIRVNYKNTSLRLVIAQRLGADMDGQRVRMACNNFRCVNPDHYRVIPLKQHIMEVAGKRSPEKRAFYSRNPGNLKRRKLTDEQVRYIRNSEASSYVLAEELGVSPQTIRAIRRGEKYKDVGALGMWSQLLRRAA